MLKVKTKEITMASQNRKKNCIEAKRFQSKQANFQGGGVRVGGGGAEIGE